MGTTLLGGNPGLSTVGLWRNIFPHASNCMRIRCSNPVRQRFAPSEKRDHTDRGTRDQRRVLMAVPRFNEWIEPMTLGNMRANGVRSLDVCCWQCHHRGIIGADARPNWREQAARESLTGAQWR
jgi:hypothetical protein